MGCGVVELARKRWRAASLQEASGALGDLGTFLPLLLSLAAFGVVGLAPALFWAGVFNLVGGVIWDTPMPVQPMKTIAAVVVATGNVTDPGLTPEEAMGAGLGVSAIVLLLGVTRLVDLVNWLVPRGIIRGLQIGLGASMVRGAFRLVEPLPFVGQADCGLLAALSGLLVLAAHRVPRIPAALLLSTVGLGIAVVQHVREEGGAPFSPAFPPLVTIDSLTWPDVLSGMLKAGLAQLPLTTLNSVVSVVDLNNNALFPDDPRKQLTQREVACSVSLMNFVGIPLGAMPMCHGAGGLAAQYRFGARGGSALLLLGTGKVLLAVLLGTESDALLARFPAAVLATLLGFAGLALASAGLTKAVEDYKLGDASSNKQVMLLLATALVTAAKGTGWGFLVGLLVALVNGDLAHVWQGLLHPRLLAPSRPASPASPPASTSPSGVAIA